MATALPKQRVIVVGGGLAGLAGTVRIAEAGIAVDLFSLVPVKRSHSVCAQGGINACNEVARQQGYSEYEHFDETIYGGDFLANQPPVFALTHMAPAIIDLLDRMGVPFNRTPEGQRDLRLFGGSLYKRTHFAGATTGQQLMYALDEQTRHYEAEGKVTKYEFWEFLRPIIDENGACKGIVAQDQRTMQIRAFRADAVVMATGGNGLIFGKSTNSMMCTGAAAARCYKLGVKYANAEFIQVHPTAIPGADKLRLMSESARGEGGRVWVPALKQADGKWGKHPRSGDDARTIAENERYYFLEERYPAYGNIVPRDIATREIFQICMSGLGVGGQNQVYLDLSFKPREELERKLGGIIEIYRKFAGEDPAEVPMRIFPGVHYTMGGIYTVYTPAADLRGMEKGAHNNMMTNIPGLYAFGEVNYQYHGANRLGANALLSCIFDGLFCGVSVANYVRDNAANCAADASAGVFDASVKAEEGVVQSLINSKGGENPYIIAKELGDEMTAASTVVKSGPRLEQALAKLAQLRERMSRVSLADVGGWSNTNLTWARAVNDMIALADPILRGGLARRESRGSHYREDFTQRDDPNFLKTTVAEYVPATGESRITFEEVETGLVQPRKRDYSKAGKPKTSSDPAPAARSHAGAGAGV